MKRKANAMGATQSSDSASRRRGSSAAVPSTSLSQEDFLPVPLEILEEIFLNLPPDQVVCVCRLVCHQWKGVADSESLWRERCRREGYRLRHASRTPKDWRFFYFLCKKRRNLLKNPRAEQKMKNWQILENDRDKWKVEEVMVPHPNEAVQKTFVTPSGGIRMKSQLIDLRMEGYNPSFMDRFQPDIKISDWYARRWDCGTEYELLVELLNKKRKPIRTFSPMQIYFEERNDQQWIEMTHVFQNYGPGVRYIRFNHGCKERHFRAAWIGIHVTDSCIEICPAMET
ncbi:F-box only protein 44-like [Chelmon rostratus]|uniref:F-box only protein 44-like n=1 Tax=Chelmon rostratus TaxID=109905 RepID=UPI001BE5DF11|nr:F-box only protein 44-like [Chelmon rostratus]